MPEPLFPSFCQGSLWACWSIPSVLSQAIDNCTQVLTSYFHRTWRWARGESLGPSSVFLIMCPALCISRNMSDQSISEFLRTSHSLISACLPQLFSNVSSSHKAKQFDLNFFKIFLRKDFLHWVSSESGKIKTVLQVVSLREPPDRSNNISLERRLGSNSAPFCSLLWFPGFFSLQLQAVGFQGYHRAGKRGMGIGQIKAHCPS